MSLPAIIQSDYFEINFTPNSDNNAGQTIVDLNDSHIKKTYDIKGMGGNAQIDNISKLTTLANTKSLKLSGESNKREDVLSREQNLIFDLVDAFGAQIAHMNDFINEITLSLGENSQLSDNQKDQLFELVSEIVSLKKLMNLGALPQGQERLEALINETAHKIANLLLDGLDGQIISPAILQFTQAFLQQVNKNYPSPALAEKLLQIEHRTLSAQSLDTPITNMIMALQDLLDQGDLSEDASKEIKETIDSLKEAQESGKPVPKDVIEKLENISNKYVADGKSLENFQSTFKTLQTANNAVLLGKSARFANMVFESIVATPPSHKSSSTSKNMAFPMLTAATAAVISSVTPSVTTNAAQPTTPQAAQPTTTAVQTETPNPSNNIAENNTQSTPEPANQSQSENTPSPADDIKMEEQTNQADTNHKNSSDIQYDNDNQTVQPEQKKPENFVIENTQPSAQPTIVPTIGQPQPPVIPSTTNETPITPIIYSFADGDGHITVAPHTPPQPDNDTTTPERIKQGGDDEPSKPTANDPTTGCPGGDGCGCGKAFRKAARNILKGHGISNDKKADIIKELENHDEFTVNTDDTVTYTNDDGTKEIITLEEATIRIEEKNIKADITLEKYDAFLVRAGGDRDQALRLIQDQIDREISTGETVEKTSESYVQDLKEQEKTVLVLNFGGEGNGAPANKTGHICNPNCQHGTIDKASGIVANTDFSSAPPSTNVETSVFDNMQPAPIIPKPDPF